MDKPLISRYFTDDNLVRWQEDFQFLVKIFNSFRGELEISLRDNYINLYFRGNNAAKVSFRPNEKYRILIHEKFYPSGLDKDKRFSATLSGNYQVIDTKSEFLHPLLQNSRLNEIYSKIKKENYSEELTFEQMLITDNLNRDELVLIDRQVTDRKLQRRRMDLLALRQTVGNQYQFLVIEVKMGNNPELKDKVANQEKTYVDHIEKYFFEYKSCYEKHNSQKKIIGIIAIPEWERIEIVEHVHGKIVVGGYSVMASEQIRQLISSYPKLEVQALNYQIE